MDSSSEVPTVANIDKIISGPQLPPTIEEHPQIDHDQDAEENDDQEQEDDKEDDGLSTDEEGGRGLSNRRK